MSYRHIKKLTAILLILSGLLSSNLVLTDKSLAATEPYIGEISITSFSFPPKGWAFCNGQLLPINQNQALFSLLGTTYGGNGQTNFALPDLRGRVLVGMSSSITQGSLSGAESLTQTTAQIPSHSHPSAVSSNGGIVASPVNAIPAVPQTSDRQEIMAYTTGAALGSAAPNMITSAGNNQPMNNIQPSLGLNYIIALSGIFPSQN